MNDVSDQLAALEATVAYVKAGRKYEGLNLDALTSRYITALEVAVSVPALETIQFVDDLGAEFELRGMQAPNWALAGHHIGLPELRQKAKVQRVGKGWVAGEVIDDASTNHALRLFHGATGAAPGHALRMAARPAISDLWPSNRDIGLW